MSTILLIICLLLSSNVFAQKCIESMPFRVLLKTMINKKTPKICVQDAINSDKTTVFLDARERREYDVSHLDQAIWVGYEDFSMDRVEKLNLDKQTNIVIYCSIGYRSGKITEQLQAAGYQNARNLYGGIFEWVNQGQVVYHKTNKPTNQVHAYNKTWGVWLKKGEKVYK